MNKIAVLIFALVCTFSANAQSYDQLETRFYKPVLNEIDSTAFIELGKQKAQSLFYQTDLYLQNTGNSSNQSYIANRIPDLFYVEEGDSLDVGGLMRQIQSAEVGGGGPVLLRCTESSDFLGVVETTNTKPKFAFNLVLKKVLKPFGDAQEEVWEVFLSEPIILH